MSRGDGLEIDISDFRFSQVPEDLSFDPAVSLQAKAVFGGLQRFGATSGDRRVSYQTVADRMGVSRDTIKRAAHDLAENGWAVIEERPGKPNRIKLLRAKLSTPSTRGNDDPGQICPDTQGTDAPGTQGTDAPRPIAVDREHSTESSAAPSSVSARARGQGRRRSKLRTGGQAPPSTPPAAAMAVSPPGRPPGGRLGDALARLQQRGLVTG